MPDILIGCEESQVICSTFRRAGYNAISCDLKPTKGDPAYHIQDDVVNVIKSKHWRLIIIHPDCTALATSGNRWYGRGKPKHQKRLEAIDYTLALWQLVKQHSSHAALENPSSVIFSHIGYMFYLQPWQHGHGETKQTGFALHNLLPLRPTKIVNLAENRIHSMPQRKSRKEDRSRTYQGVADAIVNQWGKMHLI